MIESNEQKREEGVDKKENNLIVDNLTTEELLKILISNLTREDSNVPSQQQKIYNSVLIKRGIEVVEPLIKALNNNNGCVKGYIAGILGEIQDIRAIEPLIEALKKAPVFTQREINFALIKMGIEVVEPLIKALKSNDECIRENVVWILGEIQDIRAIEPLIEALKRETDLNVKKDIEWALKRLKNFKN